MNIQYSAHNTVCTACRVSPVPHSTAATGSRAERTRAGREDGEQKTYLRGGGANGVESPRLQHLPPDDLPLQPDPGQLEEKHDE